RPRGAAPEGGHRREALPRLGPEHLAPAPKVVLEPLAPRKAPRDLLADGPALDGAPYRAGIDQLAHDLLEQERVAGRPPGERLAARGGDPAGPEQGVGDAGDLPTGEGAELDAEHLSGGPREAELLPRRGRKTLRIEREHEGGARLPVDERPRDLEEGAPCGV